MAFQAQNYPGDTCLARLLPPLQEATTTLRGIL
jgi:hypothetical protein